MSFSTNEMAPIRKIRDIDMDLRDPIPVPLHELPQIPENIQRDRKREKHRSTQRIHKFGPYKVGVRLICPNGKFIFDISLSDWWIYEIVKSTWHNAMPMRPPVDFNMPNFTYKDKLDDIYKRAIVAHVTASRVDEPCRQCRRSSLFGECRMSAKWPVVAACTSCGGNDEADRCSLMRGKWKAINRQK